MHHAQWDQTINKAIPKEAIFYIIKISVLKSSCKFLFNRWLKEFKSLLFTAWALKEISTA